MDHAGEGVGYYQETQGMLCSCRVHKLPNFIFIYSQGRVDDSSEEEEEEEEEAPQRLDRHRRHRRRL